MTKTLSLILAVAVVTAAGLAAGASASSGPRARAAGYAMGLNLQGGYANKNIAACGSTNHYGLYRPRHRIDFKGSVAPVPRSPRVVKLKIKKCVRGRFVLAKQLHVRVDSRGSFQGSFSLRGRGDYFARTYFYGARPASTSTKQHFRIR
jgi:hypothetical protein